MTDLVLEARDLSLSIRLRGGVIRAADRLSFRLRKGRVLGVVGESGSGKTMTAKSLMRIEAPAHIDGGAITLHGKAGSVALETLDPSGARMRGIRWRDMSMVFQEPMTSFGPMHTIGNQIDEAIMLHLDLPRREARERTIDVLKSVGMPRPATVADQYPHQISGGMRQRAMIAMALSCEPALLIADEPTTALDVTTEAQILELIRERQQSLGMAVLYITHNFAVVAQLADEVVVMYLGRIVEQADVLSLFENPRHPYTQALLRSIPSVENDPEGRLATIEGAIPDAFSHPPGCPFHTRCPRFMPGLCDVTEPPEVEVEGGMVRCHLYP